MDWLPQSKNLLDTLAITVDNAGKNYWRQKSGEMEKINKTEMSMCFVDQRENDTWHCGLLH